MQLWRKSYYSLKDTFLLLSSTLPLLLVIAVYIYSLENVVLTKVYTISVSHKTYQCIIVSLSLLSAQQVNITLDNVSMCKNNTKIVS